MCCYLKKLVIRNGAQFKFYLPGVFAWLFVLRLETPGSLDHINNQTFLVVSTGGAIEWLLEK